MSESRMWRESRRVSRSQKVSDKREVCTSCGEHFYDRLEDRMKKATIEW